MLARYIMVSMRIKEEEKILLCLLFVLVSYFYRAIVNKPPAMMIADAIDVLEHFQPFFLLCFIKLFSKLIVSKQ